MVENVFFKSLFFSFAYIFLFNCLEAIQITIIYTNSANGRLESCNDCPSERYGGLIRRISFINSIRKKYKNVIIVDSGDFLPVEEDILVSEYCLKLLTNTKYNAINIGDQEIINGVDILKKYADKLPFVSANIEIKDNFVKPFVIEKIKNINIGIIGVLDISTLTLIDKNKLKNIKVYSHKEILKNLVQQLKETVDIVIVLSHCGVEEDKHIAKEIPGIDIIIGAHSQTLIQQPYKIGTALILQAGQNGYYVGKLELKVKKYNNKVQIVSYKNTMFLLDHTVKEEPDLKSIVEEYKEKQKQKTKKFVVE